jgi:hypothetical protein
VEGDGNCAFCGRPVRESRRLVLVRFFREEVHCSDACLREHLRARRFAWMRFWQRALAATVVPAVLITAGVVVVRRHRAQRPQSISFAWMNARPMAEEKAPPVVFGPPWPPTDEQWKAVFDRTSWTFPLPGPTRRALAADDQVFQVAAPEPREPLPRCREPGRCGVDLGGELWGEHVYAALEGVVERVHEGHGRAGLCVRLAHLDGQVFTQYCHLAATPRRFGRGTHVRGGEVIGLLGDTGLDAEQRRRLTFSLSVRPSRELEEVYWDPTPLMARWALRLEPHGTVAGLVP